MKIDINKTSDSKITNNKIIFKCDNCGKIVMQYSYYIKIDAKHHYCCHKCRCEHQKITMFGENNPNYGHKWTIEQKEKQRILTKKHLKDDPTLRYRCSPKGTKKPNLAKKLKEYYKTHDAYMKGKHHSIKSKKLIGEKSAKKFTNEFKIKQRKCFEKLGLWIPLDQKTDFQIYYKQADWIQRMFDIIDSKEQLDLLYKHGIFNAFTNSRGVVRDHMYSRRSGFKNGVFPEILRHPCNCEILLHSENIAKKQQRYVDYDSQTLEQLFEKILNYKKSWIEQDKCIFLINEYKNGKRWKRNNNT